MHKQIDSFIYVKHMHSLFPSPRQNATELLGKIANCKILKNDKRVLLLYEIKQINRTRTRHEIWKQQSCYFVSLLVSETLYECLNHIKATTRNRPFERAVLSNPILCGFPFPRRIDKVERPRKRCALSWKRVPAPWSIQRSSANKIGSFHHGHVLRDFFRLSRRDARRDVSRYPFYRWS